MTGQEKQYLLAELKEIREEVKQCRLMLEGIKKDLPRPRSKPNRHPSNMKLPRPTWEKSFVKEYGHGLLRYFQTNVYKWMCNGSLPKDAFRGVFYKIHNGGGIIPSTDMVQACKYYCKYHGLTLKLGKVLCKR